MRLRFLLPLLLMGNLLSAQGWRNSHTLHYDSPAHYFEEALVLGNGTLGATLYGGPVENRISLNDITLWTGEPVVPTVDSMASAQALAAVREALLRDDYRAADSLNRSLQGRYSENYQPLGQLLLLFDEGETPPTHYRRWLDIADATAGDSYHVGSTRRKVSYFCSHPDQVLVVRIRSNGPVSFRVVHSCQLPHTTSLVEDELVADGYAAYHSMPHYTYQPQMFWYDSSRGIHFRTIVHPQGKVDVQPLPDGSVRYSAPGEVVLLVANATSFNGFDKDPVRQGADYKALVRQRVDQAAALGYRRLLSRHRADYTALYDRVSLDLGRTPDSVRRLPTDSQLRRYTDLDEANPDLEELYFQFGRYLLISSSRTPNVPANLQGLWNEHLLPPWSSNYTTNINLEENYWPAEVANLGEMHLPLLSFLGQLSRSGRATARLLYGVDSGWCLGHNTDIWALTEPVGLQGGDPCWANWNMGGAWLSTHLWEHFLFSRDTLFLRHNYPVLRSAADFCLGWMVQRDSLWTTMPSTSPENKYLTPDGFVGATFYGGTADMAIIRECLMDAAMAAHALDVDAEFRQRVYQVLTHMEPYRTGARGNLQEWLHDWDDAEPTHRHQTHLFGLFPGHSLDPLGVQFHQGIVPLALDEACRTTLRLRGNETTGWSTGWRVNLYARLGDGEEAYATYRRLLRYISPDGYDGPDCVRGGGTYPNLLDAHSPYQIDGNLGGCAGLCEMLLQSNSLTLQPIPALPQAWQNVKVSGLRSRTGQEVSFCCRKGKLRRLKVTNPK